jgi:hypothetical protein
MYQSYVIVRVTICDTEINKIGNLSFVEEYFNSSSNWSHQFEMAKKYFKFPVRFARSVHVRTKSCMLAALPMRRFSISARAGKAWVCWVLGLLGFEQNPGCMGLGLMGLITSVTFMGVVNSLDIINTTDKTAGSNYDANSYQWMNFVTVLATCVVLQYDSTNSLCIFE